MALNVNTHLYLPDELALVGFCESLYRALLEDIGKVQPVPAVLGIPQLIFQRPQTLWRRSKEAYTFEVWHPLSGGVVEPIRQVDFLGKQRRGRRSH